MIRKEGRRYVLYNEDGSVKIGVFDTRKQAERKEVEYTYDQVLKAEEE